MKNVMLACLKRELINEMEHIEKETPPLLLRCICINQIQTHEFILSKFRVLTSENKCKLKNIFKPEERIKIKANSVLIYGTVLETTENEINVILFKKIIEGSEYIIDKCPNYINEKLLEQLEIVIIVNRKFEVVNSSLAKITRAYSQKLIKVLNKINNTCIRTEEDLKIYIIKSIIDKKNKFGKVLKSGLIENLISDLSLKPKSIRISSQEYLKFINEIYTQETKAKLESSYKKEISKMEFFDPNLNESQQQAVYKITDDSPYKIVGPPGTGKTRTTVEIICQLLKNKQKVLICGPSNVSIDNIIERAIQTEYFIEKEVLFYRQGSSLKGLTQFNLQKILDEKTCFTKKEKNENNFKKNALDLQKKYKKTLEKNAKVVFATLFSTRKEKIFFDWVIVDEACQGSDVALFLSIIKGRNFILIGDPNQLSHQDISFFEKLSLNLYLLDVQYRMCQKLIRFSNRSFYENRIKTFKKESHNLIKNHPAVLIDTDGYNLDETIVEASKMNVGEAEIVIKLISRIDSLDIGVVTPYFAQVAFLKKKINKSIEICTVDGFQGREKDFIIISFVRSNNKCEYGFIDDYKRLNVAITRCKKGLIVIANSSNFRKSKLLQKFFKYLSDNFLVIGPDEIDDHFTQNEK